MVWPLLSRDVNLSIASISSLATAARSHTSGNFIVVTVLFQSGTVQDVTDTAGNTYTQVGTEQTDGGSNKIRMYYAYNITGHASNVVTFTFSAGTSPFTIISVIEFDADGVTSDPLQNTAQDSGTGTAITSGSITVTGPAVIVGQAIGNSGSLKCSGDGTLHLPWFGTNGEYLSTLVLFSESNVAATLTQNSSNTWGIIAAAFTAPLSASAAGGETSHTFVG